MTPQTYVEFDSDLQAALFREWTGREWGRSINATTYPVEEDGAFTWFYWTTDSASWHPKPNGGGVIELDDDVVAFATQEQTLSDGRVYSFDIAGNAKTATQLSAEGQTALIPPQPPGG